MTKTEKFWNLVDGLVTHPAYRFPIEAYIGVPQEPRRAILIMQYVPFALFEEARKRRLDVWVWSNSSFGDDFNPWSYVCVWITPDNLRWR